MPSGSRNRATNAATSNNTMSESAACALVTASFLLLGLFGYAPVSRSKTGMVFGAVIMAFVLNAVASQMGG